MSAGVQTGQPSARHTVAWWAFVGMVVVLNLPNFMPWERSLYPQTWLFDGLERLLKSVLLATLFLSLFSRPWRAWLLGWLLFAWWMPLSLAVRWVSESPITSSLMGMAMASSPGELRSLIGTFGLATPALFLAWNALCALALWGLRRRPEWRWSGSSRRTVAVLCSVLLLIPAVSNGEFQQTASPVSEQQAPPADDAFADADLRIGGEADLPLAFPYELPWAVAQYWQAREAVNKARATLNPAPAEQALAIRPTSPDIVVLVIGESSSRKAWKLFNPGAPETTPKLSGRITAEPGLFAFSNVVAQSTSTRQAVPSMLTGQPLLWPDGQPNSAATESIVSLAARAGYATAWLSNQSAVGRFDGVIAAYADEAQTRAFLNPASFFQQGSHDEVLLPALQRHLNKNTKAFVVLHTLGSHFQFEHRYPAGFGPFPVAPNQNEAYFNSIAYTDQLLDDIIQLLNSSQRSAVMVYASDHGQGLSGGRCQKSEVNRVTAEAYEVPALVWLSAGFQASHPKTVALLKRNADHPFTTAVVHQTLHDLITVRPDDGSGDKKATSSFLSQVQPNGAQRVVTPDIRWVEYGQAAARNPCFIKSE